MSAAGPFEHGLFRLLIGLKMAFWAVALATLVIGIWNTAAGRDAGPPMALIWSLPGLVVLQLCVAFAWWRTRRARFRRGSA